MASRFLVEFLWVSASVAFAEQAFEEASVASARLSAPEVDRFEKMKRMPGVVRAKLIAINEEALSRDRSSEMPFFDGGKREFKVAVTESGAWSGHAKNTSDRFIIRNINGKYSGQLLINGRQYILVPMRRGISILSEMSESFGCGIGSVMGHFDEK